MRNLSLTIEGIKNEDAITEAQLLLEEIDSQANDVWSKARITVSMTQGRYSKLAKVILVGIGELCK